MSFTKRLIGTGAALFIVVFLVSRCGQPAAGPAAGSGDSSFNRFADDFLKGWLDWRPQLAVGLGFHQYDTGVTDYGRASLAAELQWLKEYRGKLAAIDTTALSPRAFIDYRILWSAIENEIFSF